MALKRELHIEDIILGLTVLFTFLYPIIITGIILYQEAEKEDKALERIDKILKTLTGKDCEERVFEVAAYTQVEPLKLKNLCIYTEGKKVKSQNYKVEGNELFFRAEIDSGYLTVVGVWEFNRFKIIFIGYDKGR